MAKSLEFGKALALARREHGYATPFAFYRARGGRRVLGLSFANYLSLERGRSLPKAWRLEKILAALGLELGSTRGRELVRSYIRCLVGSESLMETLSAPQAAHDPAPASWMMAESASRQAISQRTVQLSLEHYRALAQDPVAYAAHVVLCNTKGWVKREDLASLLKAKPKALAAALKRLQAAGLLETEGSRLRSPLAGKFVTPPAPSLPLSSAYSALRGYRRTWVEDTGRLVSSPYLLLRAPQAKIERYLQHLADVINMSAVYGDVEPGADSALYLVEGSVVKLFS